MSKLYEVQHQPELLRYLTPQDCALLFAHTEVYRFSKGEHVIFDKDSEAIMYLIDEGSVEVLARTDAGPVRVATVQAGEVIGEISYLTGKRRSADVVALEECAIRFIEPDRIEPLFKTHEGLAARFFFSLCQIMASRYVLQVPKKKEDDGPSLPMARLHVWHPTAETAAGMLFHPEQNVRELKGGVEISFPYSPNFALTRQILSLGADCEVLAPPELGQEIAKVARKICASYEL